MPFTGRLGNLIFQYAYLRAFCEKNGYELCQHAWVGEQIWDIPHAVRPAKGRPADVVLPEDTHQRQESLIYTRKQVREWLQIKPELLVKLDPILHNRKMVLLNQRCGDDLIGTGIVRLGKQCYIDAALREGFIPGEMEWETDVAPTRLPEFQGDITASGLNTTWVALPSFYRLMTAKVLFRANSTFSFWAATLGNGIVYSPVIEGIGGDSDQYCTNFVKGNWPRMAANHPNTDLNLPDE